MNPRVVDQYLYRTAVKQRLQRASGLLAQANVENRSLGPSALAANSLD
jgi:hypothetical protein